MSEEDRANEIDDPGAAVLAAENRFYQEVTITKVTGECPG